jgi:hypothetical protein
VVFNKNYDVVREVLRFLMDFEGLCNKEKKRYEKQLALGITPEVVPRYPPREPGLIQTRSIM